MSADEVVKHYAAALENLKRSYMAAIVAYQRLPEIQCVLRKPMDVLYEIPGPTDPTPVELK